MIENGRGGSSAILAVCRVLGLEPPPLALSEEMRQWIEVGQMLFRRHPRLFRDQLTALSSLAAALPEVVDEDQTNPDQDRTDTASH